jgi:hypothetical protein
LKYKLYVISLKILFEYFLVFHFTLNLSLERVIVNMKGKINLESLGANGRIIIYINFMQ